MRFGAIFTAVLSFGLLAVAAPTANAGAAVAHSAPADLSVREAVAPVARFDEKSEVAQLETRAGDFLSVCTAAQVQINTICNDITIKAEADVDASVILDLFASLTVQFDIVLEACGSITADVDVNACVNIILQIFVTVCTCLKVCLTAYVKVDAIVQGIAAIIAIHAHILVAISLKLAGFAALFLKACTQVNIDLFVSVGLKVADILHA